MTFRLAYLHLALTNYKGHGQGHAHLESEYLGKVDRSGKITIEMKLQVMYGLSNR